VAKYAKDLDLVLHIGLHKTASTYLQNVLSARRYDLIEHGVLFPSTGMRSGDAARTRDGAQSGHALFTGRGVRKSLLPDLLTEVPPTASTVLLSAEDFTHPRLEPAQHIELFSSFRTIKVVLVLRRQDVWIESFYKQIVDQYHNVETRSFGDYLAQEGAGLLDFYARFSPWRDLVGPENFHALSYDDLPGGAEICRRVLRVAGVAEKHLDEFPGVDVPRYDSVRSIDTVGLRILNGYRLKNREVRDKAARDIYAASPRGDIELMTPEMRTAVQRQFGPVNERIEAEWFTEPVPGLRFGAEVGGKAREPLSGAEMLEYVDRVVAIAGAARISDDTLIAQQEATAAVAATTVMPAKPTSPSGAGVAG